MGLRTAYSSIAATITALDVDPPFDRRPQAVDEQPFAGQTTRDFTVEIGATGDVIQHGLCGQPRVEERELLVTVRYMLEGDEQEARQTIADDVKLITNALWPLVSSDVWAILSGYRDDVTITGEEALLRLRMTGHFAV